MKRLIAVLLLAVMAVGAAQAEPRYRSSKSRSNYILRRQDAYPGLGVPTGSLIIGRREIDIYATA